MANDERAISQRSAFFVAAGASIICAAALELFGASGGAPVIGGLPLLPLTIAAAAAALPLLWFLEGRGVSPAGPVTITAGAIARILVLGALLALPPIAIDLALGFPRGMNMPLPDGLFFYPGIALVAEAVFHLVPLAILALLFSAERAGQWLIWPVVFVEPLFQLVFVSGPPLMSVLVLGNVALVSAVQLILFQRHGFLAMIGLRLAFYLFWHIIWGWARLALLF